MSVPYFEDGKEVLANHFSIVVY